MRGEVFRLPAPREARGHEQAGARYAVVVQSDQLPLSTWLVAPTSASAGPASFRPEIQARAGVPEYSSSRPPPSTPPGSGDSAGRLTFDELRRVDAALRLVLEL